MVTIKMKAKHWLKCWFTLTITALLVIGGFVYTVDPYFHYHKPNEKLYYILNNQRSQNDGISKHFTYNALITGTSMTENFKTTEFDEIFDVNSIKVPYSGGSYKEINDNLIVAFDSNPELKTVLRCLDYSRLLDDKDLMRTDLGKYPTYLYDHNPLNDVFYLFNKDTIFSRTFVLLMQTRADYFKPGVQSFDSYSRWQDLYTFGSNTVLAKGLELKPKEKKLHLTQDERKTIYENITQNVTSLADKHPEAIFYYFFPPYSAAWWAKYINEGTEYKWFEAEQYAIELILEHENIKLFSFNNRTDITTDLNNYKDDTHYGEWINSFMLQKMHDEEYLLTKENYRQYIAEEIDFYTTFDYNSLINQTDYECDYYASALLNEEITGVRPVNLLSLHGDSLDLSHAEITQDKETEESILICTGMIEKNTNQDAIPYNILMADNFVGLKVRVEDISDYSYLLFNVKKVKGKGQPTVLIYNDKNEVLAECCVDCKNTDLQWHQYLVNVKELEGTVTILFNGGSIDSINGADSQYLFSNLELY